MNGVSIEEYYERVEKHQYKEVLTSISPGMTKLKDFLEFSELSLSLKIHLTSMLIRRSVGINSGIYLPNDVDWLIEHFIRDYKTDLADVALHETISKAIKMIQSENAFSDCIIGTVYMYTALEFYLKHKLGYKFFLQSESEIENSQKIMGLSIGLAYNRVKRANFRVSKELHKIDTYFKERGKEMGYEAEELQNIQIQGRISSFRNSILHGHYQFHHSEGTLLTLLFILLHYCELEER